MSSLEKFFTVEPKEIEISFEDATVTLKIKQITWSKKNQILSKCFSYQTDGSIQFNFDRYMKDCLCEMIIEAPWGETNHLFLSRIKPEFGAQLEKLVPKPLGDVTPNDFFGKK